MLTFKIDLIEEAQLYEPGEPWSKCPWRRSTCTSSWRPAAGVFVPPHVHGEAAGHTVATSHVCETICEDIP